MMILDREGRVQDWNVGAERVTGYSEAEIRGRHAAVLFTPEDREAGVPQQEMTRADRHGEARDERWHLRKDGSRFWASGMMYPIRGSDGTLTGFGKLMRDRTDRRRMEARLREAIASAEGLRREAEDASASKDKFISIVSHELRTPLNTVRLWAEMFMSGRVPPEEIVNGGQMLHRAAVAQQQLLDDLLDIARIEADTLRLERRVLKPATVVQDAVGALEPLAAERGIMLRTGIADGLPMVRADPHRLQQVLWNLINNAIKFTPAGGTVRVEVDGDARSLRISVADTGIGISPHFLPRVFERFSQSETGTARRSGGIGLGLAITRQLVELHGGSIEAHSEGENRGTTFRVVLPTAAETDAARTSAAAAAKQDRPVLLDGAQVLLLAPHKRTREHFRQVLEGHGGSVYATASSAAARAMFSERSPRVVVCDIAAPDEDGYAFMESLRRLERESGRSPVVAIAITGLARATDPELAKAAGFDDCVPRDDAPRLVRAIATLVA